MTSWLNWFSTTEQVTNVQRPICKGGPCQICMQVSKVDEEINKATFGRQLFLAKRCDLRSEQNRIHALVHRLPAELRSYIFELLLPLRNEWGRYLHSEGLVLPTYLASICRSWRDTAWSNPFLWSTMNLTIGTRVQPTTDPSELGMRINFVREWIVRSRNLPLCIHIIAGNKEGVEEELKAVVDVLSQCSDRWQYLSLEMPLDLLRAFDNVQYHHLKRLRLLPGTMLHSQDENDQPVQFLNPTASPAEVVLRKVSFRLLQISWNHLSVAYVKYLTFEGVILLLRHASQMTGFYVMAPLKTRPLSKLSIIHPRLKKLSLSDLWFFDAATFLDSLILPNLQTFRTTEIRLLFTESLPLLVHRSSCLLTRIELLGSEEEIVDNSSFQPLLGVTDFFMDTVNDRAVIENLVLKGYFPDLRHLILRLRPFLFLWDLGVIPELLARPWPLGSDATSGRPLCKLIVEEEERDLGSKFSDMWNSDVGKELKAMEINLTEYGFEILFHNEEN